MLGHVLGVCRSFRFDQIMIAKMRALGRYSMSLSSLHRVHATVEWSDSPTPTAS